MGKRINLVGRRFGHRVVLRREENNKSGQHRWLCRCDCGQQKVVLGHFLLNGIHQSCIQCSMDDRVEDLTGKVFGKWTVIARTEDRGKRATYLCRCECGTEKKVTANLLRSGGSKQCRSCASRSRARDLTGQKFGLWTVIRQAEGRDSSGRVIWLCRCECGTEGVIATGILTTGASKGCRNKCGRE